MTEGPHIRPAEPGDAEAIAGMLAALARELGDGERFLTTPETIRRDGFGPDAAFACLLAVREAEPLGLVLFLRYYSTHRAAAGVYVQDLWVAPAARSRQLGEHLLQAAASHGAAEWGAAFLQLTVHPHNAAALRFYERLGFVLHADQPMSVTGPAFQAMAGRRA
ncbi:N-acetyltransferase family protein [Zhengella sp. ZM62]|uniref:GNAT family N-acetyltransferase n=1 Tax=Zhengella sedimenti TaxID=3390035 RepID=UPI003974FB92